MTPLRESPMGSELLKCSSSEYFMLKRATIVAATLRTRTVAEKAEVVAATREHIWPLISAGKVVPVIHAVLPMAEAAQAHRLIDDGTHIGKILLAN